MQSPPNPHISRLFSVLIIDEDLLQGFWASLQSVGYGSTQQLLAKPDSSITIYFLSRRIYNTEPVIMTSITGPSISLQQNTYTHMLKGWFMSLRAWRWEAVCRYPRHVDQSMSYWKDREAGSTVIKSLNTLGWKIPQYINRGCIEKWFRALILLESFLRMIVQMTEVI